MALAQVATVVLQALSFAEPALASLKVRASLPLRAYDQGDSGGSEAACRPPCLSRSRAVGWFVV